MKIKTNVTNIYKNKYFDIFLISLIGLLSVTWFQGDHLIARFDFWFPDDGFFYFKEVGNTWQNPGSFGTSNYKGLASIPYAFFILFLENFIGFSAVLTEKIFIYIIFASSGLSMYYLSTVAGMKRPWSLFASFFYMLNPFFISHWKFFSAYSFAPLLLGMYINGLERSRNFGYIIKFAIIWFLTTTYMYIDPGYAITHISMFILYFSFFIIWKRNLVSIKYGIKFTSILLILILLLNFFWIFPTFFNIGSELNKMHTGLTGTTDRDLFDGLSGDLIDTLRLLGYGVGNLANFWGDELYWQWAPWYFHPLIIFIGLLIPAVVFLPLILSKDKEKPIIYYFGVLTLIGIFSVTGSKPPFEGIKTIIWGNLPLFTTIYRNPLKLQLIITIGYSVLLGFGFSKIYNSIISNQHRLLPYLFFPIVIISLFFFYPLPFWNGDIITDGGEVLPSERVTVPGYYFEAREWLEKSPDKNYRILPMPISTNYQGAFKWDYGYYGMNPDRFLLQHDTISNDDNTDSYKIIHLMGREISNGFLRLDLKSFFGLLNIKYVLVHGDANWMFISSGFQSQFYPLQNLYNTNLLLKEQGLNLSKNFGPISFYEIDNELLLPRVYASKNPIFIYADWDSLDQITNTDLIKNKPVLFFYGDRSYNSIFDSINGNLGIPFRFLIKDGNNDFNKNQENGYIFSKSVDRKIFIPNKSEYMVKNINYGTPIYIRTFNRTFSAEYIYENKWTNGELVDDNQASSGKAILNGHTLGPYTLEYYPIGNYLVTYYLKVDDNRRKDSIVDLIVSTQGTDQHIIEKNILASDFERANVYINFTLPLTITAAEAGTLEFKVGYGAYPKINNIWIDNITVTRIEGVMGVDSTKNSFKIIQSEQNQGRTGSKVVYDYQTAANNQVIELDNGFYNITADMSGNSFFFLKPVQYQFSNEIPNISFEKKSPTKYLVKVKKSTSPFFLVFSDTYDSRWKAYVNENNKEMNWFMAIFSKSIPDDNHFSVNGYVNSWYVDKTGDYSITLYFLPQSLFYLSLIISGLTFIGCVVYLAYSWKKN